MSEKRISIIIPCYNEEKYIDRCFESIENQTVGMENMEVIFVNDASTDGTPDKLAGYENKYQDDIIIVDLKENNGQGAARNIGMSYASSRYIGFLDADDCIEAKMYEKMIDAMEKHDCDFVECDWGYFSDDRNETTKSSFDIGREGFYDFSDYDVKKKYIAEQLFFTSACTKIYNRDFLTSNNLYFIEGKKYEDMFFCFLLILYTKSYYHVSDTYYHYYLNPDGVVQQRRAAHQFDMMDVSLAFLDECIDRGLYDQYKDAVEWMFLEKYYVYMIWDIWDVFRDQAYEYYLQMKDTIVELIPDYRSNPFRQLEFNKMDDMLLKLLDYRLDKNNFEKLMGRLWEQQRSI